MKIIKIIEQLKKPFVILTIGPPLVGKSTKINEIVKSVDFPITVISRDQIIIDLYGDNYDESWKMADQSKVNQVLFSKIESAVDNKENVIVDMTNMTSKRRKHTLSFFHRYTKVALMFPIPSKEELMRRNLDRQKKENKFITDDIMNRMLSSYQPISPSEGFNKTITIE